MKIYIRGYYGDIIILCILALFFIIGIFTLYSATHGNNEAFSPVFLKQMGGVFVGVILGALVSQISYKTIIIWGSLLHYIVLGTLCVTLFLGSRAMGARRWLSLGFFKFQPSELAKITLILWIVNYFFQKADLKKLLTHQWLTLIGMIIITGLVIIKQPDLGSGLIVMCSGMLLLYIAGLPKNIILFLAISLGILSPILWNVLHDYQKQRVLVFLGYGNSQKERYQLEQSQTAVGSGGLFGKGYLQGTQKNFKFLPESKTDFIFATFAEEWGLLGVVFIIMLYIILLIRIFFQSYFIDLFFPYLLFLGLFIPIIVSALFNMGMVIGLLPIVGVPLPCMSYGITHTWGTCICLGIINSILKECDE